MTENRKFILMLAASYVAAATPLAAVLAAGMGVEVGEGLLFGAPVAWAFLLVFGALKFGKKALWMLLGAPFAFLFIAMIGV